MARTGTQDALEKFRFLVETTIPDAKGGTKSLTRAGFHDMQMPKRTTNKITYREGGDPDVMAISAGLSTMEDVTLSRGAIADDGKAANDFLTWAKSVHNPTAGNLGYGTQAASGGNGSSNVYRADVTITMLNREGKAVRAWKLYNAMPVSFVPGSDLNAKEDGEKSMEALTLAYEDFQELTIAAPGSAVGTAL